MMMIKIKELLSRTWRTKNVETYIFNKTRSYDLSDYDNWK